MLLKLYLVWCWIHVYPSVWRWTWDVLKDYLLYKYWQEGRTLNTFLFYEMPNKMVYLVLIYTFVCCRLLKQMSNCSLNHFVERSVASSAKQNILLLVHKFWNIYHCIIFSTQVQRLRLLGDYHHSTRIAFVEFTMVAIYFLLVYARCSFEHLCRLLIIYAKQLLFYQSFSF